MYILIDAGNSRIKFRVVNDRGESTLYYLSTDTLIEDPLDALLLCYITETCGRACIPEAVYISSVVPEFNDLFTLACARIGAPVYFATQDIPLPLATAFYIPPMVGVDRLLLSYAAMHRYPQRTLIIVSYGTATTLNCVKNETFLGGAICPGVMQSYHALVNRASQLETLPFGDNEPLPRYVAQNVEDALAIGFKSGFSFMVEGLVEKTAQELGESVFCIATGGVASTMVQYTTIFDAVHEELVLDGLEILHQSRSI